MDQQEEEANSARVKESPEHKVIFDKYSEEKFSSTIIPGTSHYHFSDGNIVDVSFWYLLSFSLCILFI